MTPTADQIRCCTIHQLNPDTGTVVGKSLLFDDPRNEGFAIIINEHGSASTFQHGPMLQQALKSEEQRV